MPRKTNDETRIKKSLPFSLMQQAQESTLPTGIRLTRLTPLRSSSDDDIRRHFTSSFRDWTVSLAARVRCTWGGARGIGGTCRRCADVDEGGQERPETCSEKNSERSATCVLEDMH